MVEKKKSKERKTIKKKEKGITQSFLEGIPILCKLVNELGKTEVFKEKFKEIDEKIKENLKKGAKKKWGFESNVSVRPIINEVKKETSEIVIEKDYFYGRKGRKLILGIKIPKKEVGLKIGGKNLIIGKGALLKKIGLPDYFKNIKKQKYQKGILVLELTK